MTTPSIQMTPKLFIGQSFELSIAKIWPDEKPFNGTGDATKMFYGHKFTLNDEDLTGYNVQIIDTNASQNYGDEGDLIEVQIKKLPTSDIGWYSANYVRTITKAEKVNFDTKPPVPNPMIGGSAADRAMALAIQYSQYNDMKKQSIFDLADNIFDWLKSKTV